MNKTKLISVAGQIAIVATGVILGVSLMDFTKRMFIKNNFSKPLDVTIEEE